VGRARRDWLPEVFELRSACQVQDGQVQMARRIIKVMRDSGRDRGDNEAERSDQPDPARGSTEHATDAEMVATGYADSYVDLGSAPLPEPTRMEEDDDQPGQEARSDWDELALGLSAFIETAPDTPLEANELEMVRAALRDAKKEITRLERVNDAQLALIDSLSEQLSRASERLGRKDWLIMAIGAGTALVIAEVVPSAIMLHIGVEFFHKISGLFD
jgi:hypothetical protein